MPNVQGVDSTGQSRDILLDDSGLITAKEPAPVAVSIVGGAIGGSTVAQGDPQADTTKPWLTKSPRVASSAFRASGALPGSGAFSSDAAYTIPDGARRVSFSVAYTGGASGGAVKYRFLKGFSSTLAAMATEQITPGTVTPGTAPVATVDTYDLVSKRPVTDTTATIFSCDYEVEGGWTHCALQLAEYGATGTPGTAAITVAASY